MNLNDLVKIEHKRRQKEVAEIQARWERVGLLEGLPEKEKGGMAVLLENQGKQLLKEANRTSTIQGTEEWAGIALPLVRRIIKGISAKEFLAMQPMSVPNGLVFWMEFKYATGQPGFTTGQSYNSQDDSIFGVTDDSKGGTVGTGGMYGPGRFAYSINDVSSSAFTLVQTASAGYFTAGSGSVDPANGTTDINHDTDFSASFTTWADIKKITIPVGNIPGYDPTGVRAFTISATGINTVYPEYTTLNTAQTYLSFIVSGSITTATGAKVYYHNQPTSITRGDFESGKVQEANLDLPSFDLQFYQETLTAKTRKLKAQWTPEFAQDIDAYHDVDVESELTTLLGDYISQEVDLELLDMLASGAQTKDYWSCRLGYERNTTANTWSQTAANAAMYTQQTWFQTIGTKLQKISNEIHRLTMRGGANFIIAGPKLCTILESIPGYSVDTDGSKEKFSMGASRVGSIASQWQIWKNPYMTGNMMLLGYKGPSFLEAGAVYAPYIPLEMTPVVLDPDDLTPRKGVMTRYAKKLLRPEFYAKLYVEGLETI